MMDLSGIGGSVRLALSHKLFRNPSVARDPIALGYRFLKLRCSSVSEFQFAIFRCFSYSYSYSKMLHRLREKQAENAQLQYNRTGDPPPISRRGTCECTHPVFDSAVWLDCRDVIAPIRTPLLVSLNSGCMASILDSCHRTLIRNFRRYTPICYLHLILLTCP
jgi:hypothetical protein